MDMSMLALPKGTPRVVDRIERKVCAECSKVFQPKKTASTRPKQRFCSKDCASRHTGHLNWKVRPPCPVCGGKVFSGCESYCSKKCAVVASRVLKPKQCRHCLTEFRPRRSAQVFCRPACLLASIRADVVQVVCAECGRMFRRHSSAVRRGRQFCNRVCLYKFARGENSPHWRGGHNPNRGPAWRRRAEQIRKRDGYICQRCNKTQAENGQKLDVDHIIPWRSLPPDVANEPRNLVSLCKLCHLYKTTKIERAFLNGDCLAMYAYEKAVRLPPLLMSVPE